MDGEIVSSSHIRGLVLGGALEYAGTLLGEPFVVDGPVVHGDERGRTLGYPTANLVPVEGHCTPGHGVYAARARTADGTWHAAAVNVGVRPMFDSGLGELIEAHLIDFSGELYDEPLRVQFLRRLRGETAVRQRRDARGADGCGRRGDARDRRCGLTPAARVLLLP